MQVLIDLPEDVYEKIKKYGYESEFDVNRCCALGIESIRKGKPFQERQIGHWVGIDDFPHEDWECDKCGGVITGTFLNSPCDEYPYCPKCGAKMEVSE